MRVDIQTINFEADQYLLNEINERLDEFRKYYLNITGADVYLKYISNPESKESKEVGIRVFLPGEDIYADATGESFSATVGTVADKIVRQLKKRNELEKEKR